MPLETIAVQGASHCLRLSTSSIQLRWRGFHAPLRNKLRPRWHLSNVAQHPIPQQHHKDIATVASQKTCRRVHTIGQQSKAQSQIAELRHQERVRRLEIGIAYQNLRQIALGANYRHTQQCVRTLVEERGEKPNLRLYEALLLANADHEHGSAFEVARILEEIKNEGLTPDSATYHAILRVLAIHPNYLLRHYILEQLRQRWFPLTKDGWHYVTAGLIRDRQLEMALDTLEGMRKEGIKIESWLYDTMIYSLCSAEDFESALNLMQRRTFDGELHISGSVWYHLLDSASCALHYRATLFAFRARVEPRYLNPSAGMCINILNTAARHGDAYLATSILRILGKRSGNPIQLHHYEALLDTYIAANDLGTALTLLTIMAAAGHPPTELTTRPIYIYLKRSPDLPAKAILILEDLREQDRKIPIQAINVIMQASIHHRNLDAALNTYNRLHTIAPTAQPDTTTFNVLFRGCAQAARKDLAMFLTSEMVALKIAPDALTYDRLILVCLSSEANIDDAWRYLEDMKSFGWRARDGTFIALVRRACEEGDERVWKLVDESRDRGVPRQSMRKLVGENWKGGIEEAERLLDRRW